MDFTNRNAQPQSTAPSQGAGGKKGKFNNNWGKLGSSVLVGAVIVLLVALVAFVALGGNAPKAESKYVDSSKLQAVFLNTGQVYFGNVTSLNSKYFVLSNIYYLQTSSTGTEANANTNVSLVKLGCELHEPLDQMVINRDQVTFWENLGDNGQVAKAVETFEKQNPNGQKCADQSSSSSNTSGTSAQPAGTSNSGTNTTNANQ